MIEQPRFLVLRGGAIGDLILTLPVLQALRNRWPDCYIELVGYPRTNVLVEASGHADKTHSLDAARIAQLYIPDIDLPFDMAKWINGFSVVIHFLSDLDGLVSATLGDYNQQVLSRSPMPPPGVHATDHYLSALEELTIFEAGMLPRIAPSSKLTLPASFERTDHPLVTLHPGSGSAHKNWPFDRFLALANALTERAGARVVWVMGEAETERVEQLPATAERLLSVPFPELAAVLTQAALHIGNDSGIAHLAAAVGAPTLALFGASEPANWAPRGPYVEVLRAPQQLIGNLPFDEVLNAALEKLS